MVCKQIFCTTHALLEDWGFIGCAVEDPARVLLWILGPAKGTSLDSGLGSHIQSLPEPCEDGHSEPVSIVI